MSHETHVRPAQTVMLRPLATPLPLGFLALMTSAVAFAVIQVGWVSPTETRTAGLVALVFTAPLQLVACVMGFWARDPVAATGLGVQTGLWTVTGITALTSPPGTTQPELGILLCAFGAALIVPAVSGVAKPLAAVVFLTTAARCACLAVYELAAITEWKTVAGWVSLALAVLALYAAVAFDVEGAHNRTLLPIGRPRAFADDEDPGVRSTL
jgi:succinate-acetate transporter protein